MSWFRLDDQGAFHTKVLAAGNEAYGAWCRAGQWSCAHLTEGKIPRSTAFTIARPRVWIKLVEAGLCESLGDDGYQIHDFLDWNPTAEEAIAKKQARAEAGRKGGKRKAESGNHKAAAAVANGKQTPSKPLANHLAIATADPPPGEEFFINDSSRSEMRQSGVFSANQPESNDTGLAIANPFAKQKSTPSPSPSLREENPLSPLEKNEFEISTAGAIAASEKYEAAIEAYTGNPPATAMDASGRTALVVLLNRRFLPGRTKPEALDAMAVAVGEWIASTPESKREYTLGWRPKKFAEWLDTRPADPEPMKLPIIRLPNHDELVEQDAATAVGYSGITFGATE